MATPEKKKGKGMEVDKAIENFGGVGKRKIEMIAKAQRFGRQLREKNPR